MKINKYPDGSGYVTDVHLGDLKVIFNNGEFQKFESLKVIRDRIINTLEKDSSYALNLNN